MDKKAAYSASPLKKKFDAVSGMAEGDHTHVSSRRHALKTWACRLFLAMPPKNPRNRCSF